MATKSNNKALMPKKTAMRKDFVRSIAHSKGRFASILLLMALGSFALVGLFVAGPDMRATGEAYFGEYELADLSVISDYGLTGDDEELIREAKGVQEVEFGYFKDVTVDGTTEGIRILSTPERVSQLELVDGEMPTSDDQIAVDSGLADEYPIGSTISVAEKPNALNDSCVLTRTEFTVVGHVNSPEIVSIVNLGQSTAGTGSLKGYAVVADSVFDSDVYMVARLTYTDVAALSPYSNEYRDLVQAHKDELEGLLADRPEERLAEVKADAQDSIDEGQAEVDDAKAELADAQTQLADAADELADAREQIADAKAELADAVASGTSQLADAKSQLDSAWSQLQSAKTQLDTAAAQIADGETQLASAKQQVADGKVQLEAAREEASSGAEQIESARTELEAKKSELEAGQTQLAAAKAQLDASQAEYDSALAAYEANWSTVSAQWAQNESNWAQLDAQRSQIAAAVAAAQAAVDADPTNVEAQTTLATYQGYQQSLAQLDTLKSSYEQLAAFAAQKDSLKAQLDQGWAEYESSAATVEEGSAQINQAEETLAAKEAELAAAEETIAAKQAELDAAEVQISSSEAQLEAARTSYTSGNAEYQSGLESYQNAVAEYADGAAELAEQTTSAQEQIDAAQEEYDEGEAEYEDKLQEYEDALPDAEQAIADGEAELATAREKLEKLATPAYETDTRREALGSDAYKTYTTISEIVDSLARVFPVFLYLVAALVTLSTMTRMVEEERVNSGTLKALGYSDWDIAKKFLLYGLIAGVTGSVIGIALGHTLLPWIVYMAYGDAFTLPPIQLLFYPQISAVALVLALLCSVLPAWIAVKHELAEKPAQLLLPKAPKGGSKIFLERLTPVWRRMSFTHKVTARNLFRYKQRMLMTIFGVAGAVCMLVAGFGVQQSISKMGNRQFGELIRYDMIVAQQSSATDEQLAKIDELLDSDAVAASTPLLYESVSREGGSNGDRQSITMLVPDDGVDFSDYVQLWDRANGEALELPESGAIISERLSTLLGLEVGDVLDFTAADGTGRHVRIAGITEMYMGHFLFMSRSAYEECYGEDFAANASLVRLHDSSIEAVEDEAVKFMELTAVKSVVQNTTLETQVNTVVNSLDMIMWVLIVVASALGIVIMYNLTNLNVSERMRELSTIKVLGFHTNETTMYIYRETILLTILGILAGYVLGVALHEYILFVVPPDNVMFDPALSWVEFAVPAAVVAAVTVFLYFAVMRRLRKVDMLEALKSVD